MASKPIETNPFVQSLVIRGVWKLEIAKKKADQESVMSKEKAEAFIIDSDERCSVYSAGLLCWFPQLSTSAKDLFMWISVHLSFESDVIEIHETKYCEEMKVSRATFYNARQLLINRVIIPRTTRKNTYWVNPAYLYKGNRIKHYPQRVSAVNENPFDALK